MSETVIKVENLSKTYVISHQKDGSASYSKSLRESISDATSSLIDVVFKSSANQESSSPNREDFLALKDISFEINQGDRVGIIGRNGAGKSTLLKILSRITEPTNGRISINGRVASLLEVGTGFHPELTGRENIYLNGAILGMGKVEIQSKFSEIVEFAGVSKFLDTPVKKYSSGMYTRLAFSVAAHLEPEILIVDEVLAVGDVQFQKKCLGKMQSISKDEGRTVLFVSHNMDAIQRLCSKCLMLDKGRLVANDVTSNVISSYLSNSSIKASPNNWIDLSQVSRVGTGEARFLGFRYTSLNEDVFFHPYPDGPLEFLLNIESDQPRAVGSLAVTIYNNLGTKLVNADTVSLGQSISLDKGQNIFKLRIENLHLNPGFYVVGFWLADTRGNTALDFIEATFDIEVVDVASEGFGAKRSGDSAVTCEFSLATGE
ncbi:MAG: teichoic-acid-transporting ATPase [Pseudanabaena sp.]|nr:MAG: teichoic-acid-transporting ATPase [Pseudanabaena sp.]